MLGDGCGHGSGKRFVGRLGRWIDGGKASVAAGQNQSVQAAEQAQWYGIFAGMAIPGDDATAGQRRAVEKLRREVGEAGRERRSHVAAGLGLSAEMVEDVAHRGVSPQVFCRFRL